MPMKDNDSPLNRYAVTEVLCMRCGVLQPADDKCCNPKCDAHGEPYVSGTRNMLAYLNHTFARCFSIRPNDDCL